VVTAAPEIFHGPRTLRFVSICSDLPSVARTDASLKLTAKLALGGSVLAASARAPRILYAACLQRQPQNFECIQQRRAWSTSQCRASNSLFSAGWPATQKSRVMSLQLAVAF